MMNVRLISRTCFVGMCGKCLRPTSVTMRNSKAASKFLVPHPVVSVIFFSSLIRQKIGRYFSHRFRSADRFKRDRLICWCQPWIWFRQTDDKCSVISRPVSVSYKRNRSIFSNILSNRWNLLLYSIHFNRRRVVFACTIWKGNWERVQLTPHDLMIRTKFFPLLIWIPIFHLIAIKTINQIISDN